MSKILRIGYPAMVLAGLLPAAVQAGPLSSAPVDLAAAALPADELATERGGNSLNLAQMSELSENATLTGNSVSDSVTGSNLLSDGAFAGSSGFATVIQNTGNHVIIQDALILNISVSQ
jgi:hypothetical protein